MQKQLIFVVVLALFLTVFTLQNPHYTQMRFMGWQSAQVPLIIIIVASVSCGAIVSMLLSLKQTMDLKKTIRRLENEINLLGEVTTEPKPDEKIDALPELEVK